MFRPYRLVSAALAGALIGGVVAMVVLFSRGRDLPPATWLLWIALSVAAGAVLAGLGQGLRNLLARLLGGRPAGE